MIFKIKKKIGYRRLLTLSELCKKEKNDEMSDMREVKRFGRREEGEEEEEKYRVGPSREKKGIYIASSYCRCTMLSDELLERRNCMWLLQKPSHTNSNDVTLCIRRSISTDSKYYQVLAFVRKIAAISW